MRQEGGFARLGLSDAVLAAVADAGFREPTPVQERVVPLVLQGRDVMAAAQTGTGKTASFVLPALGTIAHGAAPKRPRMLVLVPTRELAQQVFRTCEVVGDRTGHTAATVVGGVGYESQRKALCAGCDVLVATPGRLLDLLQQDACNLADVRVLVLDEADRMLDMGFLPSVRSIVANVPAQRQTLLFSATLSREVLEHMGGLARNPVHVEVDPPARTARTVRQYVLHVPADAKKRTLVRVLGQHGPQRVIAFVRGRHRADHLGRILGKKGFKSASIHGGRTQGQRMRALERFCAGEVDVLVATDVLARGIHVDGVSYVVNVDVPHDPQDYVHRIGRTGRAGACGWALTLCSEEEAADLRRIQQHTGEEILPYEWVDVSRLPE